MAKSQQRSTKETKKPKKDDGTSKPLSPGAVSAPITTVVPNEIGIPVFFTYHQTVEVLKSP